jgi:hypothetical protein
MLVAVERMNIHLSVMKSIAKFRVIKLSVVIAVSIWLASCGELAPPDQSVNLPQNQNTNLAIVQKKSPESVSSPVIVFENTPAAAPSPEISNMSPDNNSLSPDTAIIVVNKLIIPVEGVKREELQDTFKASRSEGRVHDAIDIMAACGKPVIAATDGEIARFFDSVKGGITIYQFSRDKKLIYYYAHLQRRADNLQEHAFVKQGTLLGYVGDTGNSGAGNCHLHFAIWTIDDPKRYWEGTNINPYSLLR